MTNPENILPVGQAWNISQRGAPNHVEAEESARTSGSAAKSVIGGSVGYALAYNVKFTINSVRRQIQSDPNGKRDGLWTLQGERRHGCDRPRP